MVRVTVCLLVLFSLVAIARAEPQPLDKAMIASITRLPVHESAHDWIYRVASPLPTAVNVAGRPFTPSIGFENWMAIKSGADAEAMLTGELFVVPEQVPAVMAAIFKHHLDVTAIDPAAFGSNRCCIRILGEGTTRSLCEGFRAALDAPHPAVVFKGGPNPNHLHDAALGEAMKLTPIVSPVGEVKFVIGRDVVLPCHCVIGGEMGVATWAAFAGTDHDAVVIGEFVVTAAESGPVMHALAAGGVKVTAMVPHLLESDPRVYDVRFSQRGDAAALARTLRAALDAQAHTAPHAMHHHHE